jgi:hypothetical protein
MSEASGFYKHLAPGGEKPHEIAGHQHLYARSTPK